MTRVEVVAKHPVRIPCCALVVLKLTPAICRRRFYPPELVVLAFPTQFPPLQVAPLSTAPVLWSEWRHYSKGLTTWSVLCSDRCLDENPRSFPTQRAALEGEDQLRWAGGFSSHASLLLLPLCNSLVRILRVGVCRVSFVSFSVAER